MKTLIFGVLLGIWYSPVLTAHQDPPQQIRIQTQWVEMDHSSLSQVLSVQNLSNKALYTTTKKLISEKKAKVIHSTILLARSGEKAAAESIREFIYPAELEGSGVSGSFTERDKRIMRTTRPRPPSFETRNVGCTLEVEPSWPTENGFIDLRFEPEWLQMPNMYRWVKYTDAWGNADVKFPIFYNMKASTTVTVTNGKYQFINTFSPMDAKGKPDLSRKVLLFVKATVMTPEAHPKQ